jgi:hypothetical protein
MSADRLLAVFALGVVSLAGCSSAPAEISPQAAPVVVAPAPVPWEPQTVALGQISPIVDEVGTVIAKAAFTSLELDPECSPTYGVEPPATGHYMFVGMSVETTADYHGEGSFNYPSAHDFDVVPADGPTEGDVYPSPGSHLCLPEDKESFGFSTWMANGEYEGWTVIDTQHASGDLVFVPHFFTHTPGWKIAYAAGPAAASTTAPAPPAVSDDPNHCNDPDWWNARQAGDPGDYVTACGQYPYWLEEPVPYDETDTGLVMPEDDPGFVPEPCNGPDDESCTPTGYEYGYQRCGELCGEEPTSGDEQHRFGCEQGYIPSEEC